MKIRKKQIFCLCTAVGLLAVYGVLTGISNHLAGLCTDQYAAERWAGSGEESYAQLSVFLSEEAALTQESVESMRDSIDAAMVTASLAASSEEARLWYDAYSAQAGNVFVSGIRQGGVQAEVTAVGGDFFTLHGQQLAGGTYIYDSDLMQDRVVLDETLAWALFGSADVAGKLVRINNRDYPVAGVLEEPQDYASRKAYGELPRMYISYGLYTQWQAETGGRAYIHCYEAVLPDPVRNFAANTLKNVLSGENMTVLQNTERFSLSRTWESFTKIHSMLMVSERITYPYWENAARIICFDRALLLAARCITLLFPAFYGLWMLWKGYRLLDSWTRRRLEAYRMRYRSLVRTDEEESKDT